MTRILWTVHRNGIVAQAVIEDLGVNGVELIIITSAASPRNIGRFANLEVARQQASLERAGFIQAGWTESPV
jgi:hypothetical protein